MGIFSKKKDGINKELPNGNPKSPKFKDVTEKADDTELTEEDLEHIGANMNPRKWEGFLREKENDFIL